MGTGAGKIGFVSTEVLEKAVTYLRDWVVGVSWCGTVTLKIVRGDKDGGEAVDTHL